VTAPVETKQAVGAIGGDPPGRPSGAQLRRALRRHPSLFGLPALLIASLAITVFIHPAFSDFDLQSLAMGALPLAFAAAAQTVVVISGGIDLSIGSAMAVANVLAASTMENASFGESLALAGIVLVVGAVIGALNGLIVIVSRIPDVVATLTSGFIWGGVALIIMEKPGGGAPAEFLNLGAGTLFTTWLPNALILLAVSVAIIWIPLRRSLLGLRLYAVGSDRVAAFRSGVNVDRTRFAAYIFSGLFAAVGGLGLTMTTGIGAPLAGVYYTLSGLAAVVVGGVSLTGGKGGMVGPVLAAFVLTLIPTDLIFLNIDPNFGQVIQGTLIVVIVMIGGFVDMARARK
jgi:ribose transport system permease protein